MASTTSPSRSTRTPTTFAPKLRSSRRTGGSGWIVTHERSGADATDNDAFCDEELVSDCHGVSRHAQPARELTRRRELLTRTEATIQDRFQELSIDLHRQIPAPPQLNVNVHANANWPNERLMGVPPILGRAPELADGEPGNEHKVMLS